VVRTRHVSIAIRRGFNPVYRWLADRVITSGEAIRRLVVEVGVPPARVIAIPAGVNLESFPFGARAPETARELGLGRPVVGSVAMFRGSKGHPQLLQAFAKVVMAEPPSMDKGEMTDKGSINQRAALKNRDALVDELYSLPLSSRVIAAEGTR